MNVDSQELFCKPAALSELESLLLHAKLLNSLLLYRFKFHFFPQFTQIFTEINTLLSLPQQYQWQALHKTTVSGFHLLSLKPSVRYVVYIPIIFFLL